MASPADVCCITCLHERIYIVPFEVLPKTGNMTIISMLHVISFSLVGYARRVRAIGVALRREDLDWRDERA